MIMQINQMKILLKIKRTISKKFIKKMKNILEVYLVEKKELKIMILTNFWKNFVELNRKNNSSKSKD